MSLPSPVQITVILPVHDGAATLGGALDALARSQFDAFETIVVDDASADGSADLAAAHDGVEVVRLDRRVGPSAARNIGAERARGEILFFTDADVRVRDDTLAKIRAHFDDANTDAAIGLYSAEHPNRDVCSRYKNHWIRHSYLQAGREVGWFFTAVGAVRRRTFEELGGFDGAFQASTGGGDTDFGRRARVAGHRIVLDKSLEVTHQKRFDLRALLLNDLRRSYGWSRAALGRSRNLAAHASGGFANVDRSFVGGTVAAACTLAAAVVSPWIPAVAAIAGGMSMVAFVGLAAPFLEYCRREESAGFAAAAAAILFVDQAACAVGIAAAVAGRAVGNAPGPDVP